MFPVRAWALVAEATLQNDLPGLDRKELLKDLHVAHDLYRAGRHEEAKVSFERVRLLAARVGVESAAVEWGVAIVADALGDFESAFHHIERSIALDPLDSQVNHSYEVIADHARGALRFAVEHEKPADIEVVYKLLARVGEADLESHLLYARYLLQADRAEEAIALLEAVVTLYPRAKAAWDLLGVAAEVAGKRELIAHVKVEVACSTATAPPTKVLA